MASDAEFALEFCLKFPADRTPRLAEQTSWETSVVHFPPATNTCYFNSAIFCDTAGTLRIAARQNRLTGTRPPEWNDIALGTLTPGMQVTGLVTLKLPTVVAGEQFEDPRVSRIGDRWLLSCCSYVYAKTPPHQVAFWLDDKFRVLERIDPIAGKNLTRPNLNTGPEKNWLWFEHDGTPHMIYSGTPHRVHKMGDNLVSVVQYQTSIANSPWRYGEIRGGSTPILVDGTYWTFFHSSLPWVGNKRRYYMGAYAFEAQAPFGILWITPKPLLSGTVMEHWRLGVPPVVFPAGAVVDRDDVLVSYGINDLATGCIRIPFRDLTKRVAAVRSNGKPRRAQPSQAALRHKQPAKVQRKFTGAMKGRFQHPGGTMDLLAALPTMRHLGGGSIGVTVADDSGCPLEPLLKVQPYLDAGRFGSRSASPTHDFTGWDVMRSPWKSLCLAQAEWVKADNVDLSPWLQVDPSPDTAGCIVVARSLQNQTRRFPWTALVQHHRERMVFIGSNVEWSAWVKEFGAVKRLRVDNMLDVARAIAGSDLFIGNQNPACWVAIGLGHNLIQEADPSMPDARVFRENAQFVMDGIIRPRIIHT